MKASMKTSLLGLGLVVTILPVAVMSVFVKLMGVDIEKVAAKEFKNVSIDNARQVSIDIRQMCDIIRLADDNFSQSARTSVVAALSELGDVRVDGKAVEIEARNQYDTSQKLKLKIKPLCFGDTRVDVNMPITHAENKLGEILLRLKSRLRCDITILQKATESGDMLRVASTMTSGDGASMLATYFPSVTRNGARSRVISALMSGDGFSGLVDVGMMTLSANYFPLFDTNGEIVGAVFYGVKQNSIGELEKYLRSYNASAAANARVWIIDNSNPENPILRVSADDASSSMPINSDTLGDNKKYMLAALERGVNLRSNEIVSQELTFKNAKGAESTRIVTLTYYRPWKWVIGSICTPDTYSGSLEALRFQVSVLSRKIILFGVLLALVAIGIAWLLAARMSKPLKVMVGVARAHSRGDMQNAEQVLSSLAYSSRGGVLEFSRLFDSLLAMTRNLSRTVGVVNRTAQFAARNGKEVAETAERLELISKSENESVTSVFKIGKSIANSYDALNKTAKASVSGVSKALTTTRQGNAALVLLKQNCDSLSSSSEKLIERLAEITNNVDNITSVATSINEVSAQTNMLSLNASIEAERAGELGLGFAVVARRIRKLADQTSVFAQEIENTIKLVQASVNSSVIEIDTFTVKMRRNSKIILETADSLTRVIGDVESMGPKFEEIASTISSLSQSARSISAAMEEINSSSLHVRDKFSDIKSATGRLDLTSKNLLQEVSQFKTNDDGGDE